MATMLQYMENGLNHAQYEKMENGEWFATIPGLSGLWATGKTVEEARKDLVEALDGWIEASTKSGFRIPDIDGVSLHSELRKASGR
jgi:predicted RNase H-like HicB family nuclease